NRGDDALVVLRHEGSADRQKMRAGEKPLARVAWTQSDELRTLGIDERRPCGHHAAHEILLAGHHAAQAEVVGGRAAVEFVAGDVAFLDAHDAERFGAVGHDAERLAGLQYAGERVAIARRYTDLIGKFAGVREPIE